MRPEAAAVRQTRNWFEARTGGSSVAAIRGGESIEQFLGQVFFEVLHRELSRRSHRCSAASAADSSPRIAGIVRQARRLVAVRDLTSRLDQEPGAQWSHVPEVVAEGQV